MSDLIRFAIIGLGAGAVYALSALGIVLVYKGSGVVNFAHGAIGMVGAYVFYLWREAGMATPIALAVVLAMGALTGALFHLLVMRPLRNAPAVSRLIATLGLLGMCFAVGQQFWGSRSQIVGKLLPVSGVEVLPGISIGVDRLILLALGLALTIVFALIYRNTRFGLATAAVAESRRATSAQGISPDLVATVNWSVGSLLAVLSSILIVNLTGLQVAALTLLVIQALAGALVGAFRSFTFTFLGGLLVGVLESEFAILGIKHPSLGLASWGRSVPFLVIILVLVVRGRALPLRGEATERPPEIGSGRIRPVVAITGVAVIVVCVLFLFSTSMVEATIVTFAVAVIVLSLVVVTGYTGQLSLAQFALAGMGAWIATRLVSSMGVPFELAFVAGVVGAIPIGLIVGLPALRTRGVNLAVVTLGLALVIESRVLSDEGLTGGYIGLNIGSPRFFGVDFDTFQHPQRYALLAMAVFVLAAMAVANLRRGRAGRRLVAVRNNERAAAALGISVFRAKLFAFGVAAALAGAGGVLLGFRRPSVVFVPTFTVFESIFAVVYAVIGGVGYVLGAFFGAVLAPSALGPVFWGGVLGSIESWIRLAASSLLLVILVRDPNGIYSMQLRDMRSLGRKLGLYRPAAQVPTPVPVASEQWVAPPASLEITGVTVRFGGVVALSNVSLEVGPGEIVGLIGPNGAGKTTLIDAATGFVRIAAGSVRINSEDIARWSPRRRAAAGLGRTFQGLELFEGMSVRENLRTASDSRDALAYLTDLIRPGGGPLGPAAAAAVREFELEDHLDQRPEEIPYGRRRLVAIARAIAANPSVLLLDEPAAGLDAAERAELGGMLRRLADQWGMGIVLIEHDVSLVLDVCDRVTVLDFGHTVAAGPPAEIRVDPAVIAAYIGEEEAADDSAGAVEMDQVDVVDRVSMPETAIGSPGDGVIEARNLSAGYGDLAAVRDLSISVSPGEVVTLLGPNGAGKTTALLALVGELAPLAGSVWWLGSDAGSPLHRKAREGLAFVPEERAVIMGLTTQANLKLGQGDPEDALELFPELRERINLRAGLLSGGEQQMLSLARALASKPRVLLADELSLGLAPMVVDRLLGTVREAADRGVAVLIVEQHAAKALRISDRGYVLRRGRVEMAGTAAQLRGSIASVQRAYLSGDEDPG